MTIENTDARAYELMLVLKADQGDAAIAKYIDEVKKFITDLGGDISFEDVWGRRELAYKIKKEDIGYYVVLNFTIDGEKIKEITDHFRIDQMILRNLLTKTHDDYVPTPVTEADLEWTKRIRKEEDKKEEEEEPAKVEKKKVVVEEKKEEEAPAKEKKEPVKEEKKEVVVEEKEEEAPTKEKEEEKVEVVEEEKEIEEKKEEETPVKKEDEKKTIDDLDEKLKAIMNDTDLDISL